MAQLTIIYDTIEPPVSFQRVPDGPQFRLAQMAIPDDLAETDVYNVARRLAELLLEQLR
jgi:hypothetical protein